MSTTLEVILKTTGFTEGATAIKKVGDEATNTNNKLKTTTSTVDQVSKSTTSLGSKLANAGKQFSGTITNVAALGSTVVNLSRQYQDLSDTQIRVDRTQLKVSKSAEAVRTAQGKLNAAVKQYGASSAEAQKAQLDLTQAQEASTLAVTMNGEAVEDQQRAYENFYMGLAPTILTAGSSITSMLKEMGGEKGIGGLVTKLKGLGGAGGLSGFSGLTAALGPLAIGAIATTAAILAYQRGIEKAAAGGKELELAKKAKNLAEEIEHIKKAGEEFKLQPGKNPIDFLASISGVGGIQNLLVDYFTKEKVKAAELATETDNLTKARERLAKANANPALTDYYTKEGNAARLEKQHAEEALKLAEAKEKQIPPTEKLTTAQAAANKTLGETNTLLDTMTKANTGGKSVFYTIAQTVDQLKASFIALNQEADRNQFMKLLSGGNPTAITKNFGKTLTQQPALDSDWFIGSWAEATDSFDKGFDDMVKTQADAAAKIKADQKAAAEETMAAWDKTFNSQKSALDKIFAAYHKLHPERTEDIMKKGKKVGERKFAAGQLPIDLANKAMEQFESGLAHVIISPASAKQYAKNWVTTAAAHMGGAAGQLLTPITEYIRTHSKDAPEAFLFGLKQVIAGYDTTTAFQQFLQPGVTVAQATAEQTTAALGEIKVPPASLASVNGLSTAIQAIPPKTVPSVAAKVIGTVQVNALTNAIANVKSKSVTVTVKANLDRQLAGILPGATANVKRFVAGKQHGYSGTVHHPTMFMVGEGGRPEDVTVRPRGSVQRGGSGGGGGSTHITVSFEPQEFAQFIRYRINDNQGVVK